jgi:serine phosphatase RsbU (regulator of sigma subunit)
MASSIVTKQQLLNSGATVDPGAIFREFNGIRVGGLTLPMPPAPVGGDSVGAVAVGDGFVSFITDGQGKGTAASRLGTMMRHCVLNAISGGTTSPTAILHKLNHALMNEHKFGAAAILHCDGSRFTASVAGFPAPALFHPDGSMEQIPITGTILGFLSLPEFDSCTLDILPSTFVTIFSDGVTEAEAPGGELFALERFGDILDSDRSMAANVLQCLDAVLTHSGLQRDDISLLIAQAGGLPNAAASCVQNCVRSSDG